MIDRGDRAQAGRTNSQNRKVREALEKEAEEVAQRRLEPFPIDLKAAFDGQIFGDLPTTAKMLRLFFDYPAFVKGQMDADPTRYALGDASGRGGFMSETVVRECREILERCRDGLSLEYLRAFEGVLTLWEEGYRDPDFRRRLGLPIKTHPSSRRS